jgi:hypothetical protein
MARTTRNPTGRGSCYLPSNVLYVGSLWGGRGACKTASRQLKTGVLGRGETSAWKPRCGAARLLGLRCCTADLKCVAQGTLTVVLPPTFLECINKQCSRDVVSVSDAACLYSKANAGKISLTWFE